MGRFVKSKSTGTILVVADAFLDNLFKHNDLPDSIVSDREKQI